VCVQPSCTVGKYITFGDATPSVDGRDLYEVEPMCSFTGSATIPVYFAGLNMQELTNHNYQRCAGSRFTVNIDFSVVDNSKWLVATANEGFDIYNNNCYQSSFYIKRNGCHGYNCSATFYFLEAVSISELTSLDIEFELPHMVQVK
jgi:hypothetical protein